MVTQAPRKTAVFAALAFALSCIGLIIFVWTQFGGTIPFASQGYRVGALFNETGLLVPNADVRISGVTIGKVSSVQARGVYSYVTMDIDHQYAPIPVDTHAILRQKTLLGEAYIELSPGNGSGPKFPDGGTIPSAQVAPSQPLDKVLSTFDKPTQQDFEALLAGTVTSLAGRGLDLNNAFGNLDSTVTELQAVVAVLDQQSDSLRRLVSNGATVLQAVGQRSTDLQTLITAGDQVFSATAARNAALASTVDALPPFTAQLRTTLITLNGSLGLAKPSLDALQPAAPLLTPALEDLIALSGPAIKLLHEAPSLLRAAALALPAMTRFNNAFHPAIDVLLPAVQQVAPIISYIGLYQRELVTAMSNLSADLEATAPAATTGWPVTPGTANYIRALSAIGRESAFGQSIREPINRNNTYFSPGELAQVASTHGLLAASCANVNNPSQVQLPFTNVPCTLQPQFPWGNGIPKAYFPRITQAKK